jgi:hypothetical protein
MGVIYWLVCVCACVCVCVCAPRRGGSCSFCGVRKYIGEVRCLCVIVGSIYRVNSGHVLTRGRYDLPLVWVTVSRIPWCAGDAGIFRITYCR